MKRKRVGNATKRKAAAETGPPRLTRSGRKFGGGGAGQDVEEGDKEEQDVV